MDPEDLLSRYLDDSLSEDERETLTRWLKEDPENLLHFTDEVLLDQQIRAAARASVEEAAVRDFDPGAERKPDRPARWRPLAGAAAGLVMGLFGASVVWAISSPRATTERLFSLVNGGFEEAETGPRVSGGNRILEWRRCRHG